MTVIDRLLKHKRLDFFFLDASKAIWSLFVEYFTFWNEGKPWIGEAYMYLSPSKGGFQVILSTISAGTLLGLLLGGVFFGHVFYIVGIIIAQMVIIKIIKIIVKKAHTVITEYKNFEKEG